MESVIFGVSEERGLEVIERAGRYFVRYDAGAHQVAWREDEISAADLALVASGREGATQMLFALQRRLETSGVDPYRSNWSPWPAKA